MGLERRRFTGVRKSRGEDKTVVRPWSGSCGGEREGRGKKKKCSAVSKKILIKPAASPQAKVSHQMSPVPPRWWFSDLNTTVMLLTHWEQSLESVMSLKHDDAFLSMADRARDQLYFPQSDI